MTSKPRALPRYHSIDSKLMCSRRKQVRKIAPKIITLRNSVLRSDNTTANGTPRNTAAKKMMNLYSDIPEPT